MNRKGESTRSIRLYRFATAAALFVGPLLVGAVALLPSTAAAQDVPYDNGKPKPKPDKPKPPAAPVAPKATPPATPAPPAQPVPAKPTPPVAPVAVPKPPAAPVAVPKPPAPPAAPPAKSVPAVPVAPAAPVAPAKVDPIEQFKKELAPYGSWVVDPNLGQVWVPSASVVGSDFAPYRTNGHWAVDDKNEWAWASDYKWGNVPFHYGRWIWRKPVADAAAADAGQRGWAWVPGKDYAPAWVVWRLGNPGTEYVGWAPMAPAESWVDSSGAAKKPGVLPFYFVETDHLFDAVLNDQIVSDLGLASGVLQNSHVLDAQQTVGVALAAVSPTFDLARIPAAAIPKLRIKRDPAVPEPAAAPAAPSAPAAPDAAKPAPVAAPVAAPPAATPAPLAAEDDDAADEDDEDDAKAANPAPDADDEDDKDVSNGRFATPPPDAHQIRDEVRRATRARVWRRIHRHFRVHPQGFQPHDAKCGWTMTYPSYWRCGY